MKTFFIAVAAATTGLLIAGNTFAPQAANAQTANLETDCHFYSYGKVSTPPVGCTVQFDQYGASAIRLHKDGTTFVRGVAGVFAGERNAECLREPATQTALCPIGNFAF